jgi:hypothetical protein
VWLQSQTAIAAHILELVKRNQPASEGDTHDGLTHDGHPICQNDKTIQDIRLFRETFTVFDTSGVPLQHMGLYLIRDGD